jgi:uncharacterized protein (UPF0332 family)
LLQVSARDLATADRLLPEDVDWAFNIVYNAVLQAGRALVLHGGYRPRGGEQHLTIVLFLEEALGSEYRRQVNLFDQMRRKRHRLVYETAGLVSRQEAEQALSFCKSFRRGHTVTSHGTATTGNRGSLDNAAASLNMSGLDPATSWAGARHEPLPLTPQSVRSRGVWGGFRKSLAGRQRGTPQARCLPILIRCAQRSPDVRYGKCAKQKHLSSV